MVDEYFRNKKNGNAYYVIRLVKMKDIVTRKWHDAVLYRPTAQRGDVANVRELSDFKEKFERISK